MTLQLTMPQFCTSREVFELWESEEHRIILDYLVWKYNSCDITEEDVNITGHIQVFNCLFAISWNLYDNCVIIMIITWCMTGWMKTTMILPLSTHCHNVPWHNYYPSVNMACIHMQHFAGPKSEGGGERAPINLTGHLVALLQDSEDFLIINKCRHFCTRKRRKM